MPAYISISMCAASDHLPGNAPSQRREITSLFAALARAHGGRLGRSQVIDLLAGVGGEAEVGELLWQEMGLPSNAHITTVCTLRSSVLLAMSPSTSTRTLSYANLGASRGQGSDPVHR